MAKKISYSDKLKDPRWQKKRLEIFERDKFTCRYCRSKEKTLNVHHIKYSKGRDPWEYDNDMLETLCEDCHDMEKHISDFKGNCYKFCYLNDVFAECKYMGVISNMSDKTQYKVCSMLLRKCKYEVIKAVVLDHYVEKDDEAF